MFLDLIIAAVPFANSAWNAGARAGIMPDPKEAGEFVEQWLINREYKRKEK